MSVIFIVLVVFSLQCSRPLRCSPQQLSCKIQDSLWRQIALYHQDTTIIVNDSSTYWRVFADAHCMVDFSRYTLVVGVMGIGCRPRCGCVKHVVVHHGDRKVIVTTQERKDLGCWCKKLYKAPLVIQVEKLNRAYTLEVQ